MGEYRAIVFDLDGTLIDSYRDVGDALNDVLTMLGQPTHEPEAIKTMIGSGVHVLLERGLRDRDPELLAAARQRFKDAYRSRLTRTTRPYPGVLEALSELRARGVPMAIATNKPSMYTNVIVEELGLLRAGISSVASADEARARKPDPSVVQLALDRAEQKIDPREAIYVGDMPIDHATARAFGCPLAGVAWGFDPGGLQQLSPERWMEEPRDLLGLASATACVMR